MGKTIMARRATTSALKLADSVSREEYKAVKHMSKVELVSYMSRVWQRGYDKGHEDGVREAQAAFNAKGLSEHTPAETGESGQE